MPGNQLSVCAGRQLEFYLFDEIRPGIVNARLSYFTNLANVNKLVLQLWFDLLAG